MTDLSTHRVRSPFGLGELHPSDLSEFLCFMTYSAAVLWPVTASGHGFLSIDVLK